MKTKSSRALKSFVVVTSLLMQTFAVKAAQYDSSGRDGTDGSRHYSGGTDASRSTPGTDAGDISLTLTDLDRGGRAIMQIVGTVGSRGVNDAVNIDPHVSLHLRAKGGDGGDGGHGGKGTTGSTGSSGSNATRHSNGTDGGRGGDGGDGGDGTPGSDGGDGGNIKVNLASNDMHLAMLVSYENDAGRGGDAGSNGAGGDGGSGGSGGSSYSWSEKVGENCSNSLVSQGDYSVTVRTCTDIIKSGSNSGGSTGPRGSDGNPGRGNISAGSGGRRGSFQFVVTGPEGTRTYQRATDLQTVSYQFRELNPNGIFEPGEEVEVSNIKIQNKADMPWVPGKARAIITLLNTSWIIAQPLEMDIPAVPGGGSTTLPQTFKFRIRDNMLPVSENRLSVSESITPLGKVTRIEKTPRGLALPKTLVISYPVEISPLTTRRNGVTPGETVDISWSVKNVSTQPIGLNSKEMRSLVTSIREWRPKGEEAPGGLTFNGQRLSSTFAESVALLAPGASYVVKGKLTFDKEHLPYTSIHANTGATLKTIESTGAEREVQLRSFKFTIAQTFAGHKDSQWLVVTNGGTKRDEYLAWLSLAKKLGKKVDVWDLSYQGDLTMFKDLAVGGKISELYQGKTIIVLNNMFEKTHDKISSKALMAPADVIRMLGEKGARFYFVGGEDKSMGNLVRDMMVSSNRPDGATPDYAKLMELVGQKSQLEEGTRYVIPVTEKFAFKPDEGDFQKRVSKLRAALLKNYPERRFIVEPRFTGIRELNDDFYRLYNIGEIALTPSLNVDALGAITWLSRNERESQSPDFVAQDENMKAIVLASNMKEKYQSLKKLVIEKTGSQADVESLIAGIFMELAETLDTVKANAKPLDELVQLANADTDATFKLSILAPLAGRIEFYSKYGAEHDFGKKVGDLQKALAKGTDAGAFKKSKETELERLKASLKARRKVLVAHDKQTAARHMLVLPLVSRAIRSNHVLSQGLVDGGVQ